MQIDLWTFEISLPEMPDLNGFDVEATDGSIGHVDEATYDVGVSYLVVDTGPWIFGKKVLLPASALQRFVHERTGTRPSSPIWRSVHPSDGGGDMPRLFSIKPGITLRGRKFLGIRGWNGKPTHPPLTDFPIVCYVLAALFDVVSWLGWFGDGGRFTSRDLFRAATLVLVVGFIVSLATATTGLWDWWKGLQRDRRTGIIGRAAHTQVWRTANWHMTVMFTTTGVVIVDLLVRSGQLNASQSSALAAILSVIAAVLVSFGATYGGTMVFDYQFNVQPISGTTVWDETETDQLPGQKAKPIE